MVCSGTGGVNGERMCLGTDTFGQGASASGGQPTQLPKWRSSIADALQAKPVRRWPAGSTIFESYVGCPAARRNAGHSPRCGSSTRHSCGVGERGGGQCPRIAANFAMTSLTHIWTPLVRLRVRAILRSPKRCSSATLGQEVSSDGFIMRLAYTVFNRGCPDMWKASFGGVWIAARVAGGGEYRCGGWWRCVMASGKALLGLGQSMGL